ncbi:hypothetical protein F2Q69_00048827 [Brassica cretica]|uniref:Uncharacterized protein n=1 Tax=Brassica cretica TaxID=69181 RepID=A0A8S9PTN5_BRACR|nr:hypothetical protein F2Q69_00048827 [Brassica cretica]
MAVDDHDELPEATQREAELHRQIDDLQGQVTGLHRTREETNPELSSEFQILKEKLNEHSKQLKQSDEKLSQLESENLTLRDENQALNAASNKKRRFRTQVRPMLTLETLNSGAGTNLPTTAPGGDASTQEKAKDAQTYDMEDIDSEPEPDKEASDGAARTESPMIGHLHQMFSDRLDAMQSMVERLPGAYDGTTDPDDHVAQKDARRSTPKGVTRSYHVQRFQLHSDRTHSAMVYQLTLHVHSLLRGSQRQVRGAIRQQQRPEENLRQPQRNPAPSGTPLRLHSPLQSREGGYPRMQYPHCYLCFQERSAPRWRPIQGIDCSLLLMWIFN